MELNVDVDWVVVVIDVTTPNALTKSLWVLTWSSEELYLLTDTSWLKVSTIEGVVRADTIMLGELNEV